MDDDLGVWFDKCPPAWRKVISGSAAEVPEDKIGYVSAFPGPIYDYPNVWAAGKHINTHVSRLLLNQVIVRCIAWVCAPSDHTLTKEYIDANRIGTEQVADIISSTPYFFGWTGDALSTPYFPCGTSEMPKGLAGVSCMWPLLATGSSRFATRKQRIYVKARLAKIAEEMGIRQADVFSKVCCPLKFSTQPLTQFCSKSCWGRQSQTQSTVIVRTHIFIYVHSLALAIPLSLSIEEFRQRRTNRQATLVLDTMHTAREYTTYQRDHRGSKSESSLKFRDCMLLYMNL